MASFKIASFKSDLVGSDSSGEERGRKKEKKRNLELPVGEKYPNNCLQGWKTTKVILFQHA